MIRLVAIEPADDDLVVDAEALRNDALLDALQTYADRQDAAIADLADDMAGVHDEVGALSASLAEDSTSRAEVSTVALSDEQWADMQDAWVWCKGGFSVGLFLVLLLSLFSALLFGCQLWDVFSDRWRL